MGDYGQYIVPSVHEMVNFKVGQPAPKMLPLDLVRRAAVAKFAETDPTFLQYGYISGYKKFRISLAKFLTEEYSAEVDPEKLFVTNGITGAISLICSLFCQAGDLVFLEEPSYFLALSIMKDFKMNIRQIRLDEDGLDMIALENLLKEGIIPKLLYTIPTCHNPTGRTMSTAKRKKLVELSVEYGFMIVADEVYQLLSFPQVIPPPPMFTFDTHGTVLALGSFSKILAPALRCGWIQASPKLLSVIFNSGQLDSGGGITPVISGIIHSAIDLGFQKKHLEWTKDVLWKRADKLMNALRENLPEGTTFEVPNGGYFILAKLPEGQTAADLFPIATKHKVQFLPGASFGQSMQNYFRLSFSFYDPQDLIIGAKRLGDAIKEYQSNLKIQPVCNSDEKGGSSTSDISVVVHGATGRLGALISKELGTRFAGPVGRMMGYGAISKSKVVIDVTTPLGTRSLLQHLQGQPLVVGTTGDLPLDELREYAKTAPVLLKSNFSLGIPLLTDLAKRAVNSLPAGWNVEIAELHHSRKIDAPSGTAKTLKRAIESTGAAAVEGGVPCKSLRLGDELGQHTVYLAGPGERIELKHQATRAQVFVLGAIRAAEWIVKQPNGLHVM